MIKRCLIVGLFLLCILSGCADIKFDSHTDAQQQAEKSKFVGEENKYFEVLDKSTEDTQLYEYVIYNKYGKVARKEEAGREPHIVLLQNGLLEIMISCGSPAQLYRYYDINNDVFSNESFWNRALVLEDGKIVYMSIDEGSKQSMLVIQDIFDKNKYYKEVHRDFSPFAVPSMLLKETRVLENGNLEITYFKGEEQSLETEIIDL